MELTGAQSSKKRKRADRSQLPATKRTKSSGAKSGAGKDGQGRNVENGINEDIARMDGRLLSDYVAQKAKYFEKHLTVLELEDKLVSGGELRVWPHHGPTLTNHVWLRITRLMSLRAS